MAALCCFAAPSIAASEVADAGFGEVVEVEVVNVDVYVTDRAGNPVTGLGREDFQLFEDGRPVEISNFSAVVGGRPAIPAPIETETPGVPIPTFELPEEQRLWLIVYVDNFHIEPLERDRMLPRLESFLLRTLGPGDRTMLVSHGRELRVRRPFSDDLESLVEELRGLRGETGFLAARSRDRAAIMQRLAEMETEGGALDLAQLYADSVRSDTERTLDALRTFIQSLAGLPGRKALLYVSSGVPRVAGEELFELIAGRFELSSAFNFMGRYDMSRQFQRLAATANEHRVAFYALDVGGLRPGAMGGAEFRDLGRPGLRTAVDASLQENPQSSLRLLSAETGGRAILNLNEPVPALEQMARDFRTFYSLGYPATGDGVGRYHRIEVRVDRPGTVVRHRGGYRALGLEEQVKRQLRAALLYDHQANPLGLEIGVGTAAGEEAGGVLLPLHLRIPLRDVVLVPRSDGSHEARLRLFVGAVDETGRISEIDVSPLGVRIPAAAVEAARGEALLHTHRLVVRPGRQKIAVAVVDLLGRQRSLVARRVRVEVGGGG